MFFVDVQATLRQEGLIGKLRSERPEPVLPDWESSKEPQPIGPSVTEQSETLQPDTTAAAEEGTCLCILLCCINSFEKYIS